MPQSIHRYRGYLIGLEWKHGVLLVSVSPATPDLPILGRCIDTSTRCEAEAMVEAKNRVDRALSNYGSTSPMSVPIASIPKPPGPPPGPPPRPKPPSPPPQVHVRQIVS